MTSDPRSYERAVEHEAARTTSPVISIDGNPVRMVTDALGLTERGAVTYKGKDRRGTARTGRTTDSPVALAERLFGQKWLWAAAERDGILVGGIGFNTDTGRRCWWAEGGPPQETPAEPDAPDHKPTAAS
jgi:hypothetical protein